MKLRVVLVKPPEHSTFNFGTFSLGSLAAAIRHLADVSIVDATQLSPTEGASTVWKQQPHIVGVTVMGLKSVIPASLFIRCLKNSRAGSKNGSGVVSIIAGGHGASMMPVPLLQEGADAVVIGEGELTFTQILQDGIRPGAPGVACLQEEEVIIGPVQKMITPLDDLPPPARDLMPPPPDGIHLMETSRGCPHSCTFCETTRFYGRRWRPHSPRRVAVEVKRLIDDYDAWVIHFADDNFTASPRRVQQICTELQKGSLPVFFMASARADDLVKNEDLLSAMAATRIQRISVGVETLNPILAAKVEKPISPETFKKAFTRMRQLDIFSVASFIVGLPGENEAMRERSVELAVEAGPDSAHFLPFLPLPGTPLAAGRKGVEPDLADVLDARRFNEAFMRDSIVRGRLGTAADEDGVRGLLARATLKKYDKSR